jgi:hypothetical protein
MDAVVAMDPEVAHMASRTSTEWLRTIVEVLDFRPVLRGYRLSSNRRCP